MARLRPRLEVEGCLFTHVEPWLDPEKIEDLWYFEGPPETPEQVARIFAAVPTRVMFVGHYHRWLMVTPEGVRPWSGDVAVVLDAGDRYLVAIHAVCREVCPVRHGDESADLLRSGAGWLRLPPLSAVGVSLGSPESL